MLIDEAQILYSRVPFFWKSLKRIQDEHHSHLHVLLLSMYGEAHGAQISTPIEFPAALGLNDMRLPHDEFEQLVETFISYHKCNNPAFNIANGVRATVFRATGGHVSLVQHTLSRLQEQY